jgi:hypothetical protein
MDLFNLIPKEDTITVEIKHPVSGEVMLKDDGTPMTIKVYGPHSKQYKDALYTQTNKRLTRSQKNRGKPFTAEEMENSALEVLVDTTADWDIQFDKKSPKFDPKACRDLYDKLPWIKGQVLEAQEDYESFLKG